MNQEQAIHELEEARRMAQDRRSFERYQALILWQKTILKSRLQKLSVAIH